MNWTLPTSILLVLLLAPVNVSAEWADDNAGGCSIKPNVGNPCVTHCASDAPPQVVNIVLHCAATEPGHAYLSFQRVLYFSYVTAESGANLVYNQLDDQYDAAVDSLAPVDEVFCAYIYDIFCGDPYPEWPVDINDPIRGYPIYFQDLFQ